tara:strand:+ start:103135 stop:104076 length:942 start_codon:yes stop_codon:yes gene_type:complete
LKKIILVLLLITLSSEAQNYVDLLKVGYGQTFNNNFDNASASTEVKFFEADLTFPVVINDKNALITGVVFSKNRLQLYPDDDRDIIYSGVDQNNYANLFSTTLKLGLASTYNEKWSSTIVLLPKIASDYNKIKSDDFYMGGLALLKLQKKENLIYRFGFYGTTEAFGFFTTPIIGWYYLSENNKFEMDMSLPIAADINYDLGALTLGIDYFGIGRSFRLYGDEESSSSYVDLSSLEFASYAQISALQKCVLLRAKLGYATSNYEVYADGDKIDLGVSAFSFGDNRQQLNPRISGGVYFKIEAIYRFQISEKTN